MQLGSAPLSNLNLTISFPIWYALVHCAIFFPIETFLSEPPFVDEESSGDQQTIQEPSEVSKNNFLEDHTSCRGTIFDGDFLADKPFFVYYITYRRRYKYKYKIGGNMEHILRFVMYFYRPRHMRLTPIHN